MREKCKMKGCRKSIHVFKHGLCRGHYEQLIRKAKVIDAPTRKYRKLSLVVVNPT